MMCQCGHEEDMHGKHGWCWVMERVDGVDYYCACWEFEEEE